MRVYSPWGTESTISSGKIFQKHPAGLPETLWRLQRFHGYSRASPRDLFIGGAQPQI